MAVTTAEVTAGDLLHLFDRHERMTVATVVAPVKVAKDGTRFYSFTTEKLTAAERTAKRIETLRLDAERANTPEAIAKAIETAERIDARLAAKAAATVTPAVPTPSAPAIDPTGVLAGLDPATLAALLALLTPAVPAVVATPSAPVKPRPPKAPAKVAAPAVECAACGKPRVSIHLGCKLPVCAACFTADTDTVVKRAMRRANLAK